MNKIIIQYYKTKIGEFIMGSFDDQLCMLDYRYRRMRTTVDKRIKAALNAEFYEEDNEILKETRNQLDAWLDGKRKVFDIPILLVGTDFQKSVWEVVMSIKYGETTTYMELAKKLGNEKGVRAVASVNGANALSLIVPCHRIIGSDGSLVGYGGGLAVKKRLLNMEKRNKLLPY